MGLNDNCLFSGNSYLVLGDSGFISFSAKWKCGSDVLLRRCGRVRPLEEGTLES